MKKPTFREQYDKIVGAYMRDELRPFEACSCFVGNLLGGADWAFVYLSKQERQGVESFIARASGGLYTPMQVLSMERLFMSHFYGLSGVNEDTLYSAMEATLQTLRDIHESNGEVIEDYQFKRREIPQAQPA